MQHEPKIEMLRTHPGLNTMSDRALRKLSSLVDDLTVPAGKVLQREGALVRAAYVVTEGRVALKKAGRTVEVLERGSLIGSCRPSDRMGAESAAITLTETRVLVMTMPVLFALMDEPAFTNPPAAATVPAWAPPSEVPAFPGSSRRGWAAAIRPSHLRRRDPRRKTAPGLAVAP